jgi:hypothetical protein
LNAHSSCLATFDAIVKSERADIDEIIKKHTNIFCAFETSFIYYAECKNKRCKMVHNIDISDYDFNFPTEQIKCQSCQRLIKFDRSDFKPLNTIQRDDLIRFFNLISEKYGLFLSKVALNCVYCANPLSPVDDDKIRNIDLLCPHCEKIRYVEPLFTIEDDMVKIIGKEQGYWLEWYVWRKLESHNPQHNITFKQIKNSTKKFDADVCLFSDEKFIIIECKDTSNIDKIFSKLYLISQIADKYVLVSTSGIDGGKLESCKNELGDKFEYIPPDQIMNIETSITNIIKTLARPPKSNFTMDKTTVTFPRRVVFTDNSLNSPTSWKWDFGDGSFSDLQNPEHQYRIRGVHTVTLQVANDAGADISNKTLRVL